MFLSIADTRYFRDKSSLHFYILVQFFSHMFPSVPSDAELLQRKAAAYEEQRAKTLAENKARMIEKIKSSHISKGLPMEEIEKIATRYVYESSRRPATTSTKRSKITEEKETHPDPTYEPDADEMANADDNLSADEEELSADNPKKKVVISSFISFSEPEKCYSYITNVFFFLNNQAKVVPPTEPTESASPDTSTRPDGEDAELQITPTGNLTSRGSNSPEDNQIVITKQKGIHIFTSICLLLVSTKLL